MQNVKFRDYNCNLVFQKYANGRAAINLIDAEDETPVATATVNLPGVEIDVDEVLIKDWSENEGMLKCLEDAGVVKATGRKIPTGFVEAHVCKLLRTK